MLENKSRFAGEYEIVGYEEPTEKEKNLLKKVNTQKTDKSKIPRTP